jgi:2-polyprenyl-3-methyl-5-hydroxy-6-metoxy-1,4-benzoquinol methylase
LFSRSDYVERRSTSEEPKKRESVPQQTVHSIGERDDLAPGSSGPAPEAKRATGCLLCGEPLEQVLSGVTDNRLGSPGSYEIRRCVACGFEQTYPLPTQAELTELYTTHYNFGGQTDSVYTRLREWFLFSFANRLWVWLDGDVAFHRRRGTGRLLDIGCNEGRGLRIHASNGFLAEGLEVNEKAARVARGAGFEVQTCLLEDFRPGEAFDVAVLSNVLEHSLEPRRMLRDVYRILGQGGQVWISCPNSQSWLRGAFGRSWINWHVPFHISHFSAKTLRQLLEQIGFVNIEIRDITPALWVSQSLIVYLFAKPGRKTWQLRNPFLTVLFMTTARLLAFPALWLGNLRGKGDCLQVTATKA